MSASRLDESTLRPTEHLLAWALCISVATHLLLYGVFEFGHHHGWWTKDLMPEWLKSAKQQLIEIQKKQAQQQLLQNQEPPLLFVEVDPATASQEPPKNATHYSSRNAKAANPDATIDTQTPKIDGSQSHVPKTQSAPRTQTKPPPPQPQPPAPKEPKVAEKEEAEQKPKPKGGPKVGDMAMAKPAPQPGEGQAENNDTGQAETLVRKRPHTLTEVKRSPTLPGEKMRQEGGVRNHLVDPNFDTRATPFGEYDDELVRDISARWWDLLESKQFSRDSSGRVVVQFTLHYDGRVTDVTVLESNVGELLTYVCQRGILDPAPFQKWPADMRQYFGRDFRVLKFTFYYE